MPSSRKLQWLRASLFFAALLSAEASAAAERVLVLEVVVNGRATGRVGEFVDRDGTLYISPADLADFGLVRPDGVPDSEPIPFSLLPNVRATVDEVRQNLLIVASDAALQTTQLGAAKLAKVTALTPAEFGALINYEAVLTYSDGDASGGALVDVRLFGPHGVLESSALVSAAPQHGQRAFVRLGTTYTFSQPSSMRRLRAGDVVSGALPWSRAVRLGGVQVASDFGLRPDLITFPVPQISSSAAVPSTVNVMVNGIRHLSEQVPAGPFAMRTLPVVTGAGNVSVAVVDALGQQTLISRPFYASSALLKPGLASYSVEFGLVREDFGLESDHYSGWAASQSSRLGVTDWLTLESHAEATSGMGLVGVGGTMLIGTIGIANVAVAASTGRPGEDRPPSGGQVSAGFQRVSPTLSAAVSGTFATAGYRDVAAEHGAPVAKSTLNASLGYQLGEWGNVGLAYHRRQSREQPDGFGIADPQIEMVTGSYGVSIGGFSSLYATGFKNLRDDGAYGLSVGLGFAFGGSSFASVETSLDDGAGTHSVSLARAARKYQDFGYRLRLSQGESPRRSAEGEYFGSWGRVTAGIDHSSGRLASRAGARGSLVMAGGDIFASDRVDDSFAIVSTGDVAGVPVLYENRPVGRTNSRGKLLLPSLRSFQDNRLTVDPTFLPPDIEVGKTAILVRPFDRSGVSADFEVRRVNAALLTLHDSRGQPLPLGSVVEVEGAEPQPVGHDGAAYVTGLRANNRVQVTLPDGGGCAVQFDYVPAEADIPEIGPLRCQ